MRVKNLAGGAVQDIDKGWNRITKDLEFFSEHDVFMGWVEGKKEDRPQDEGGSKIKNAALAAVHEFGTTDKRIPPGRLGLREWTDRSREEIGRRISDAFDATLKKGNAKRQLNRLGLWGVSSWRKYLRDVQPGPEWAISTEKKKVKSLGQKKFFKSKKLIETAQLINGATHVLRKRKGS